MEKLGNITLYNCDCMEIMKGFKDKQFDLAIVDPPYGININPNLGLRKGQEKRHKSISWDDAIPTQEYFNELFRVSQNQIIWGGNYFPLPPTKHVIFWDKLIPDGMSFSDGELAWTSFDRAIKKYTLLNPKGNKIHPTQKPIQLYKWLLKNYAHDGDTILDTHLGSASSAIAAHDGNFEFTGIELDEEYYDAAKARIVMHQRQLNLF